ncbi:hypothetical protein NPA31_011935 [Aurantimonas sp. MSK8Z-1]|uniref:hypothetical protein n=1 Tax=Mangrovibrevibacter kandeliae TaxID=2968473 RepID=UPI00211974E9|nr:hypothetical protein [Aurantimonas sp. MSK8Z-1]MCW4115674.1 hypothetical protein [Aurantimonas sp. MSK8Z-1]
MAAGKAASARRQVMTAERARQESYDREAQALNTQSQDRYEGFTDQQQDKATDLGDYFAAQTVDPGGANAASVLPASASNITIQEENGQRGNARQFTQGQGQSLGRLRAFGDLLGSIGRDQARDASQIGILGGFKQGSSSITPYEMDAASHAGDGLKLFGDILGGVGSLATSAGLGGVSLGGGASAALGTSLDPWAYARTVGGGVLPRQAKPALSLGSLFG